MLYWYITGWLVIALGGFIVWWSITPAKPVREPSSFLSLYDDKGTNFRTVTITEGMDVCKFNAVIYKKAGTRAVCTQHDDKGFTKWEPK